MYTIWFRMHDQCPGIAMHVDVECINGSLVDAQKVWDTLAVSFYMVSTRP